MNNKTRDDFASYGLEILKRCVLYLLHEQNSISNPYWRHLFQANHRGRSKIH